MLGAGLAEERGSGQVRGWFLANDCWTAALTTSYRAIGSPSLCLKAKMKYRQEPLW